MAFLFKQAVCFTFKSLVADEKNRKYDFQLGTHEVPEEVMRHPFFLKMVQAKLIVSGVESKPVLDEKTIHENLVKKIAKDIKSSPAKPLDAHDVFPHGKEGMESSAKAEEPSVSEKPKKKK